MLTGQLRTNFPEIDFKRAVSTFDSLIPHILNSPSVLHVMDEISIRPVTANTRGGRKKKPLTLPDHWHVEFKPGDIRFFNDLSYAKYVYAPRVKTSVWPVAEKVQDDNTPAIFADIDAIWREANVSALFLR